MLISVQCFTYPKYKVLKGFTLNQTSPFYRWGYWGQVTAQVSVLGQSRIWSHAHVTAFTCPFTCNIFASWVSCFPELLPQPPHTTQCTRHTSFLIFCTFHPVIFHRWKKTNISESHCVIFSVCVSHMLQHLMHVVWSQKVVSWHNYNEIEIQK